MTKFFHNPEAAGENKPRRGPLPASQFGEAMHRYAKARERALLAVAFICGVIMAFVAFSAGVDQGTTIGIESCRAGDSVAVDPAVGGLD